MAKTLRAEDYILYFSLANVLKFHKKVVFRIIEHIYIRTFQNTVLLNVDEVICVIYQTVVGKT